MHIGRPLYINQISHNIYITNIIFKYLFHFVKLIAVC